MSLDHRRAPDPGPRTFFARWSPACADAAEPAAALAPARITIGGAVIDLEFAPGHFDLNRAQLIEWVAAASRAVVDYYGRFPVGHARIEIVPIKARRGVGEGATWGSQGAFTRIFVGETTRDSDLRDDWIMTHEMVHYAFPSVSRDHHWIEEGIATYVEPIARMEAGEYSAARVWGDLIDGLPKGLPAVGDEGLDHTHTWGRTYWGGALFCLLADVRIRRETHNRFGLRDALRGIVRAGGNVTTDWTLERTLAVGDQAVGVPVLTELDNEMKATAVAPDLDSLWHNLGVEDRDGAVTFDDSAPWAAARHAIAHQ
jgi:hypothetical protein